MKTGILFLLLSGAAFAQTYPIALPFGSTNCGNPGDSPVCLYLNAGTFQVGKNPINISPSAITGPGPLTINKTVSGAYKGLFVNDTSGGSSAVNEMSQDIEVYNVTQALATYRGGLRIHLDANNTTPTANQLTGIGLGIHANNGTGLTLTVDGNNAVGINNYTRGLQGYFQTTGAANGLDATTGMQINHQSTGSSIKLYHQISTMTGDFIYANAQNTGSGTFSGNFLNFNVNAASRFLVTNSGNMFVSGSVGINQTGPSQSLDVKGNALIENGGIGGAFVGGLYFASPVLPTSFLHQILSSHSNVANNLNILKFSLSDIGGTNHVDVLTLQGNGVAGVGTTDTGSGALLQVSGAGIQIVGAAQPACDATHRGEINVVGATHTAGVKDSAVICMADATNAYAWRTIY